MHWSGHGTHSGVRPPGEPKTGGVAAFNHRLQTFRASGANLGPGGTL